jgi:hypothetical protein
MKKEIKTSIIIDASAAKVWSILSDFEAYPDWNPFIKSIEGEVQEAKTITVKITSMVFKPKVLSFRKKQEIKWLGHFIFKGVFDGEHCLKLEQLSDGRIKFHHSEKFSGLLVGLMAKKLDSETKPGFIAMNEALKERAEKAS